MCTAGMNGQWRSVKNKLVVDSMQLLYSLLLNKFKLSISWANLLK